MTLAAVILSRPAAPVWQPCGSLSVAVADPTPGQLWLVEAGGADGLLPAVAGRALARANVVIYDRAAAPAVAALLPPGAYAEAGVGCDVAADIERCVRFAAEGWSVVRVVADGDRRGQRLHRLAAQLAATARVRNVALIAETEDGACAGIDVPLDRLVDAVDAQRGRRLTIVAGAAAAPPQLHAVAANGLAG